jgi:D-sedoheptulose 7-phosphate isomerase
MQIKNFSTEYLNGLKGVIDAFNHGAFERLIGLLVDAYHSGNYIFTMGNGGSASTASHFACDINKGCCCDLKKKFKVICLNDNIATMLAYANDASYEVVFEEQLKNFLNPKDLVIGISGSGNSENVLRAIRYAGENGGRTIGLSGFSGGKLSKMVDIALVAEVEDMQKIEDMHMIVVHMIMQSVHRVLRNGCNSECP